MPNQIITTLDSRNTLRICRISRGGMGEVYRAQRMEDNRVYALKIPLFDMDSLRWHVGGPLKVPEVASMLRMFIWEAQVWITLGKHQNIVQAHWFEWLPGYRPGILVEYVQGERTLRDWVGKAHVHGGLPAVIQICVQVLTGLIYAKEQFTAEFGTEFAHRDMKPENVMLTVDGLAKVTDFGLARRGVNDAVQCGTPPYMAPEQWKRNETDERTDVYAVGCMIFELLTGTPPFREYDRRVLEARHLGERPSLPPKTNWGEEIPQDLHRILMTCLEKNKDKRFTYNELRDRLRYLYYCLTGQNLCLRDRGEFLDAEDLSRKAVALARLGKLNRAFDCINEAIRLCPREPKYYVDRGAFFFETPRYSEALGEFDRALALDPRLSKAILGKAHILAIRGSYRDALVLYRTVQLIDPYMPEAYLGLANTFAFLGEYSRSLEAYRQAERLGRPAEAHLGMGNVYWLAGDLQKAEREYHIAIDHNPFDGRIYTQLKRFYEAQDRTEEAKKYGRLARELQLFAPPLEERPAPT